MEIGVVIPTGVPVATGDYIRAAAMAAEERGFASVWAPEHVVFFEEYGSRYPYSEDGRIALRTGGPIDPFTALTFAAAVTSRIRLGTGICLVPQRNPVYTAKEVASLDWLSGGRFDFGIGIGWLREEFQALGVPWGRRAARTMEYLRVMQALWAEGTSEFHGEFYDLPACWLHPKPVQRPHPPLIFGGESDAALERVAELGQGWYGYDLGPEEADERIGALVKRLERRGRSRADVKVTVAPNRRPVTPELMEGYARVGVDQVIVAAGGRDIESFTARLDQLAESAVRTAGRL